MSILLEETQSKLRRTEHQLVLVNQEIKRLSEFGCDVDRGLAEVARQREFMKRIAGILLEGEHNCDLCGEWLQ